MKVDLVLNLQSRTRYIKKSSKFYLLLNTNNMLLKITSTYEL
jgi:hypothetical protein